MCFGGYPSTLNRIWRQGQGEGAQTQTMHRHCATNVYLVLVSSPLLYYSIIYMIRESEWNSTRYPPAMTAERDPITCHVLNTLTGRPASGIRCVLIHTRGEGLGTDLQPNRVFEATTDGDGRVNSWTPRHMGDGQSVLQRLEQHESMLYYEGASRWQLRFYGVGEWYKDQGVDSFWTDVTVEFLVQGKPGKEGWRHYHVPVLLGPWSYTTYRGS